MKIELTTKEINVLEKALRKKKARPTKRHYDFERVHSENVRIMAELFR